MTEVNQCTIIMASILFQVKCYVQSANLALLVCCTILQGNGMSFVSYGIPIFALYNREEINELIKVWNMMFTMVTVLVVIFEMMTMVMSIIRFIMMMMRIIRI